MSRKLLISGALIFLSATILAFANRRTILLMLAPKQKTDVSSETKVREPKKYDQALIAKLDGVIETFAGQRPAYTIAGTVNLINKADTNEKMDHVEFLLSKDGNNFYYKMGKIETINEDGVYLNINEETKKIFIAEKKQSDVVNMINMDQLKQVLQTENYDLFSKKSGSVETISLINEHHYSCKEYTITFDTLSKKLTNVFYRLAYFKEPMNKNKEKLIDIKLTQADSTGNLSTYNNKSNIIDGNGKLRSKYAGYELIHL